MSPQNGKCYVLDGAFVCLQIGDASVMYYKHMMYAYSIDYSMDWLIDWTWDDTAHSLGDYGK